MYWPLPDFRNFFKRNLRYRNESRNLVEICGIWRVGSLKFAVCLTALTLPARTHNTQLIGATVLEMDLEEDCYAICEG